ncbi:BQ2448_1436 [Microbotryum intermedium]|uniref:BQ2448_1436 protein n=1 Tax=Microbotryum intermedium TaxID=269621 RepID=A0A238F850_9BASI|nr:BQ2448_1436 [Microbotryum intermedium]
MALTTPPLVQALVPRAVIPSTSETAPLPPGSIRVGNYICRSQGECEPCPADEIFTSVCTIYGHRKPLICERSLGTSDSSSSSLTSLNDNNLKDTYVHTNPQQQTPQQQDSDHDLDLAMEQDGGAESKGTGSGKGKGEGNGNGDGDGGVEFMGDDDDDPSGLSGFGIDPDPEASNEGRFKLERRVIERRGLEETTLILRPSAQSATRRSMMMMDDQDGPDEILTWEACQRVVKKEKEDYHEFVLCNLFFATASILLLIYRHRVLASRQYGRLAARIGLSVTR